MKNSGLFSFYKNSKSDSSVKTTQMRVSLYLSFEPESLFIRIIEFYDIF